MSDHGGFCSLEHGRLYVDRALTRFGERSVNGGTFRVLLGERPRELVRRKLLKGRR